VCNRNDLTGRVALVLGGTTGIGRSISHGLAAAGAAVVPSGRRPEMVEKAAAEIRGYGRETIEHPCDATDLDALERLLDAIQQKFQRIDILVNSAGAYVRKPAFDISPEEWDHIEGTNLKAMFFACQKAGLMMRQQGGGAIINIASMASFADFPNISVYCISKAGVVQLTKSLASEWAPLGIRVNAIAPGFFLTALNEKALADTDRRSKIIARTPMGRLGELDDLQGAAVFLASDASRFVTGVVLPVDGGFLARAI
jgi:NAD(P)-dependent dehydrogenase (short-subunit alcohol dehydrogenase family)